MKWLYLFCLAPLALLLIDTDIAHWTENWSNPSLTNLANLATLCINPGWICSMCGLLTVTLIAFNLKAYRFFAQVCASLASGLFLIRLLKFCVGRSRPKMWLKHNIHECQFFTTDSHYLSFPSSHAFGIFALAFIGSHYYPRYKALFFAAATTLSLSRLVLHQHYASDISAACVIAFGSYCLIWKTKIGQTIAGLPDRIMKVS